MNLNEFKFFKSQPLNIRTILTTNILFAMVLPIVEIFAGAYIMRSTGVASNVIFYQLAMYVGVALSAVVNGLLLKRFKSNVLYSFGIIVSGLSLVAMMFTKVDSLAVICLTGFLLGLATGFFWTNRYLLTLYSTNDDNRNYFFGFESFFFSFWNIVIPFVVGWFITLIDGKTILGLTMDLNAAYRIVTIVSLIVRVCAVIALSKGDFQKSEPKKVFHIHFHKIWRKMLGLASLKGMVQGFLVTAPAILVLKFIGNEGALGSIQSIGCALTAVLVYILGRVSKPEDRMKIFGTGLFVFFIGTLCCFFTASAFFHIIHNTIPFIPLWGIAIIYPNGVYVKREGICFGISAFLHKGSRRNMK